MDPQIINVDLFVDRAIRSVVPDISDASLSFLKDVGVAYAKFQNTPADRRGAPHMQEQSHDDPKQRLNWAEMRGYDPRGEEPEHDESMNYIKLSPVVASFCKWALGQFSY